MGSALLNGLFSAVKFQVLALLAILLEPKRFIPRRPIGFDAVMSRKALNGSRRGIRSVLGDVRNLAS
jgi:hypothetical protein